MVETVRGPAGRSAAEIVRQAVQVTVVIYARCLVALAPKGVALPAGDYVKTIASLPVGGPVQGHAQEIARDPAQDTAQGPVQGHAQEIARDPAQALLKELMVEEVAVEEVDPQGVVGAALCSRRSESIVLVER